ncbi:MAG TPA: nucleotidyltransferase [Ktedonobacter sp.]|nr:nucleotidyltransferase [Ktedonobacter sp.]
MRKVTERLRDIQEELVQTWVTHNLYIIGEATRAIASDFPEFKDEHPEIKWIDIIGMRTVLAHRYFDTDPDILWAAVTHDLHELSQSIDAVLENLE